MARRALPDLVSRSLTLLRAFVILSAVILASGAVVLGTVLAGALRDQAVDDAERSLADHTEAVVGPYLVANGEVVIDAEAAGSKAARTSSTSRSGGRTARSSGPDSNPTGSVPSTPSEEDC